MKKFARTLFALALVATALPAQAYAPPVLKVGFTPWENPNDMAKTAAPMVDILTKATGMKVQPFLSTDYSGVISAMQVGKVDVAFFPPAAYVMAERRANAQVLLKSEFNGKAQYYGAIITRQDTGIKTLKDLKGHTFAFVDPTSASGAIYPKAMLMDAGVNPERDFSRMLYANGHDAVVLAVVKGKVDAGAVYCNDTQGKQSAWNTMLKDPKERAQIRMLAVSKPIPADNLAVRKDLDPAIVAKIKKAFLDMSATPEGRAKIRAMYHVDGFLPAKSSDYESMREALRKVNVKL
ncbi:MAG TPA: phosphate/phosphite/phosphonate ABC transporter substrate-binding protein [Stenomitos sp.]